MSYTKRNPELDFSMFKLSAIFIVHIFSFIITLWFIFSTKKSFSDTHQLIVYSENDFFNPYEQNM